LTQLEEGGLPKQTAKNTLKALDAPKNELVNPFKVLAESSRPIFPKGCRKAIMQSRIQRYSVNVK